MESSATLRKVEALNADPSFSKELTSALENAQKKNLSEGEVNTLVESLILANATKKGIDLTKEELQAFNSESLADSELAAASGGGAAAACAAGGGVQSIICGVGGFLTGGASAIASLVTVGGAALASSVAD